MVQLLQTINKDQRFQNLITGVILLAGVIVGMETSPTVTDQVGGLLHVLDKIILAIFCVEVVVKMGAEWPKPHRYFLDPWNIFDFLIVAVCFAPVGGQYVAVLRLARLLRVLKLVRAVPKLQLLVSALLKSIPSMGYVALLLGMLFYVYSVASVFLFGANDPIHFNNIAIAMLTLFRVVTGEDWTDVMYIQMWGCDKYGYGGNEALCTDPHSYPVFGALFFVSFMFLGAMIILNLFIGVIMTGMGEAKSENDEADRLAALNRVGGPSVDDDINSMLERVTALQSDLNDLKLRISKRAG